MQNSIAKLEENLTSENTPNGRNKTEEIRDIRANIIKHHLTKFCKANATALALIFKALMRGEILYSKVQFLQDCNTNGLLCQSIKDSDNLKNQQKLQKESQNSKINGKDFKINQTQTLKQQPNNDKIKSQENTSKESLQSVESKLGSSDAFPLNIEG
ncbi:hypothetical protein [uncultured Helicobacter sp.]|uniref:hypothetical protein n=1 Tax=uncultured Helicobacter sp. TaxID=175537 RepID=UPI002618FF3E|nr:hypothetical protein [uncultured Helicobacter sp.]